MSATTPRPLRRERRAAELAARRAAARTGARSRRARFGLVQITIGAVAAGAVLIALAIGLGSHPTAPSADLIAATAPAGLPAAGRTLGRGDAPVSVEIYEDFQCPACRRWGETVFPSLASNELAAGTARLTFRDYAFIGPESQLAARAGWAANEQGRFWDLWATLYANQGLHENAGTITRDRLIAMADLLRLDRDRFVADLDSSAAASAVVASSTAAEAAGVTGTPAVFVAGQPLSGGYAELRAAIAAAAAASR
jgi:protein-disulfide isomerase